MNQIIPISYLILLILSLAFGSCPVEDDPTNLARCIQVDATAILYTAKNSGDLTSICAIADRYMVGNYSYYNQSF